MLYEYRSFFLLRNLEKMSDQDADKIEIIKKHVKSYPDFPKQGILFRDIFPLLLAPQIHLMLREVIHNFAKKINPPIECVAGIESRGFLIGPVLALDLQVPFVPIRKKGKLPGKLHSVKYLLEYGEDNLEVQQASVKRNMQVLLVDDLIATGGSLQAACELIAKCGGEVIMCLVIIELVKLAGKSNVSKPVHSLLQF